MGKSIRANLSVRANLSNHHIEFTVLVRTPGCRKSRGRYEVDFEVTDSNARASTSTFRGDWVEASRDQFELRERLHVGRMSRLIRSTARLLSAECD